MPKACWSWPPSTGSEASWSGCPQSRRLAGPRVAGHPRLRAQPGQLTPLPILFWDERLSTVAAERALLEADTSRSRRAELIDKVAATLILQGALDRMKSSATPSESNRETRMSLDAFATPLGPRGAGLFRSWRSASTALVVARPGWSASSLVGAIQAAARALDAQHGRARASACSMPSCWAASARATPSSPPPAPSPSAASTATSGFGPSELQATARCTCPSSMQPTPLVVGGQAAPDHGAYSSMRSSSSPGRSALSHYASIMIGATPEPRHCKQRGLRASRRAHRRPDRHRRRARQQRHTLVLSRHRRDRLVLPSAAVHARDDLGDPDSCAARLLLAHASPHSSAAVTSAS